MLCNRCGSELPSDTPVCPRCGPATFGSGVRAAALGPAAAGSAWFASGPSSAPADRGAARGLDVVVAAVIVCACRLVAAFERPHPVTLLAIVDLGVGAAELIVASAALTGRAAGITTENPVRLAIHAQVLLVTAFGLWTLRPIRFAQLAMAALALFTGSASTIAAIPIVIYLVRPGAWQALCRRRRRERSSGPVRMQRGGDPARACHG